MPLLKSSIQIKIGFLMILAVILLSATGYLSYRNLSSIVNSIQVDLKPDQRMLCIRDISMDLEKAQNSIRIYNITNNTPDLKPYYNIISNLDRKVSRLRTELMNDSILLQQTDTIGKLIAENILIWNELLYLHNNQTVLEDLKQLSTKLDSSSAASRNKERNILKRVFSSNIKNRFNEKEIISDLKEIEHQDSVTKEQLSRREARLAVTGTEIKEKFYDLITKIENEISDLINQKAGYANTLATKTYVWLAMFSICGTLLAILVMLIIIRYVRKTYAYQIALQNSKDESEKLARTKELFMANMSHEIRTPVTAISGFTEQLLHEPFDENTTRALKIIKSSSDHLGSIINDILDFSKLQNSKLSLEELHFNTRQILEDVYALFEKQALRNNTKLSYHLSEDTPDILLGDPYRLKQIIINLVSNSVKFTKNGTVDFSISSTRTESDKINLILDVIDTGIGIEESKIDFIFEDFTQEEMNTTRKYGGTGLGLSIVKKLIELHNGKINCESKKNHGTKISCIIPYRQGDEKQIKRDTEPLLYIPEEIRNLKVLIADDEEYNRLLFKTILDRWKISYNEVGNGMEALEILKTNRFDLMFMDARMPGIDGLRTTQFIRDELNINESDMPVICISAASVNEDWQKYRAAGMNAFLPKPFTEQMLLTTILSVIKDYTQVCGNDPQSEEINKPGIPDKINLQNLYHISGGDEQFVKQMLISFIDSTEKGLNEMTEALKKGKTDIAGEQAHKILPPCRHIGAIHLSNLLKKLDEGIKNNIRLSDLKILSNEVEFEFDIIRNHIKEHIRKIS